MKKLFTLIAALVFTVAAMAATINVNGHKTNVVTDGTLYQYAFDTEVGSFYFCITGEAVLNQHYNLSQMTDDYTFFKNDVNYYAFTSVDFVMTGEDMYSATVACEDGNTYNLTVAPLQPIDQPKATVYLNVNSKARNRVDDYIANYGLFQIMGQDDNDAYYLSFTCYADQIAGSVVDSMVYTDYTALYDLSGDTTEIEFNNLLPNAVFTGTATDLDATINFVGTDSILYIITFTYDAPVATDTTLMVATDLTIYMDYWDLYWAYMGYGYFAAQASDDDYIFYAQVSTENDWYDGVYAEDEAEVAFYNNDDEMMLAYEANTTNFVLAKVAGTVTLTGEALCYGDVLFSLLLSGDASAVENVEASDYQVYNEGRVIVLNGAEGQNAAIYDIAGRMISNTTVNSDNARFEVAAAGVYVVRVNGESFRVVVK